MREKTRRGRLNEYGNEYGKYAACVLSGFVLYGCDVVLLCLQLVCDSDHGSKATFFHFLYIYPVCP